MPGLIHGCGWGNGEFLSSKVLEFLSCYMEGDQGGRMERTGRIGQGGRGGRSGVDEMDAGRGLR